MVSLYVTKIIVYFHDEIEIYMNYLCFEVRVLIQILVSDKSSVAKLPSLC